MNFNQLRVPSHMERAMDEKVGGVHSTLPGGTASMVSKDNSLSWDDIERLISKWDVRPAGYRVFAVRIMRTQTSGEHGAKIWIPDDYAQLSNDVAIIAAGCDATMRLDGEDRKLLPGDTVATAHWSGANITRWWMGSEEVMVMNNEDILGMVETVAERHIRTQQERDAKEADNGNA